MTFEPWKETSDPICQNCRYWADEGDFGYCHRFPPKVVGYPDPDGRRVLESEWPMTEPEDSCGEWEDNHD